MYFDKTLMALLFFLLLATNESKAQEQFEIYYELPGFQYVRGVFEVEDNMYVAICISDYDDNLPVKNTLFLKFSGENDIMEYSIQKQDTVTNITKGFAKDNGNYFLMGSVRDTLNPEIGTKLYICETDHNFTVIWEKMYDMPEQQKKIRINDFRVSEEAYVVMEGHFIPIDEKYIDSDMFLAKVTMNGEMIASNYITNYQSIFTGEDLIIKPNENGYYLLGPVKDSLGWSFDWLSIDTELNIIDRGGFYGTWNYFDTPLTVKKLSNDNLIYISNNGSTFYYAVIDVRISDMDLDFHKDTMLIKQDTSMFPGYINGMDFIDEGEIFIVGYSADYMFLSGTNDYNIYVLDSELNFKGTKVYGGMTRYAIMDILATSDGGCVVVGAVPDFEGSYDYDIYIMKTMAGDIYTHAEDTPDLNDRDVSVWPNPFDDKISAQTFRKGLQFQLFDEKGGMAARESLSPNGLNNINTSFLKNGAYVYKIVSIAKNQTIQTGKLIKK